MDNWVGVLVALAGFAIAFGVARTIVRRRDARLARERQALLELQRRQEAERPPSKNKSRRRREARRKR